MRDLWELGDRAIEFPLFGYKYDDRSQRFREGFSILRQVWKRRGTLNEVYRGLSSEIKVFPKPTSDSIPLVMAGFGQQCIEWIAENMDA